MSFKSQDLEPGSSLNTFFSAHLRPKKKAIISNLIEEISVKLNRNMFQGHTPGSDALTK